MTTPTTVTLSVQLVDAVLTYLGTRPYAEIARLIHAVQAEAKQSIDAQQQAAKDAEQAKNAAAQAAEVVQAAKAAAQDGQRS